MQAVKKPAASLAASPVDGAKPKPSTPVTPAGMQAVKKPAVTSPAASPVKAADKPIKPAAEEKPPAQDAPH
jgi:hypothetical protein